MNRLKRKTLKAILDEDYYIRPTELLNIPEKKHMVMATHCNHRNGMGGDILVALTKDYPYKTYSNDNKRNDVVSLWIALDDGEYWFWASYMKYELLRVWDINYECRRVLIEKTGFYL